MAHHDAIQPSTVNKKWLNHAEDHLGDTIRTLRQMREHELNDITDARENQQRFLLLADRLDSLGETSLAATAREGAALEAEQIARNTFLLQAQGTAIGLLQFMVTTISKFAFKQRSHS